MARSGERSWLTPPATTRSASMSRPESVSSRMASAGVQDRHLEDLVALLLAAREPLVYGPLHQRVVDVDDLGLLLDQRQEVHGVQLRLAAVLADRVEGRLQEVDVADAGDLHRVLEREEHALARPVLRAHGQQVLPLVGDGAPGDLVARPPRQHVRERRLPRPVRPHDRVHLARVHGQVQPLEDVVPSHLRAQPLDLKHWCSSCPLCLCG